MDLLERARFVHRADYGGDHGQFYKIAKPLLAELISAFETLSGSVSELTNQIRDLTSERDQLKIRADSHERTAGQRSEELHDARIRLNHVRVGMDQIEQTIESLRRQIG